MGYVAPRSQRVFGEHGEVGPRHERHFNSQVLSAPNAWGPGVTRTGIDSSRD